MKAKSFLFDLDGVLTDTARYHYIAWKNLCDDLGLKFDKQTTTVCWDKQACSLETILELNGCASR